MLGLMENKRVGKEEASSNQSLHPRYRNTVGPVSSKTLLCEPIIKNRQDATEIQVKGRPERGALGCGIINGQRRESIQRGRRRRSQLMAGEEYRRGRAGKENSESSKGF